MGVGVALSSQHSPWWPPGEGLSADNQGTDLERGRKKKSTQAPDRILICWGGMSEAAQWCRRPVGGRICICSLGGGQRGPAWVLGDRRGGEGFLAQTGRNAAYPERTRCHILEPLLALNSHLPQPRRERDQGSQEEHPDPAGP